MDVTLMDYSDLVALRDQVVAEVERRDVLTAAEGQLARLAADVYAASGTADGERWTQPVTLGYPKLAVVRLGVAGLYYRSLVPNNVWAPGDEAAVGTWERVYPDGGGWAIKDPAATGPRAWIPDMQVVKGDLVTYDGVIWAAKLDHRTHIGWVPSAATHAVWSKVGPAPKAS